ncbi:MAG: asparagine synthetase B, partial [Pseudomonadota bacterium]
MCGLLTEIARKPIDDQKFAQGLKAIEHRGPDSFNSWKSERGGEFIQMGHTRLSIIDLAGGQQPLVSHDETIVATVNGEFYDYKRIRKHLQDRGHHFKTESDSEILIALYEEYSTGMFEWLRGEFAFILHDRRKNLTLAARDRFGIKPLHYHQDKDSLFFCSEIKSLKSYGVDLKPDHDFLMGTFLSPVMMHQRTAFEGVRHLDPGYYYVYKNGELSKYQYWDIDPSQKQKITKEEAVEAYSEKLKEAIRLRLVADVPVASYLSGGIDSSAIFSLATKEFGYD